MIYETPFTIYTHLSDRYCRLTMHGMAQLFQEVAELHCTSTGVGFRQLYENGKAWVLSRVSYRILSRYPRLDEQVRLRTWSRGCDGLYCYRDFEILSQMNEVLVAATSQWVIIDYNNRHVVRIRTEMQNYEHHEQSALAINPEKIIIPEGMQPVRSFHAPYSAIDKAQHVNNAEYIRWIEDVLPGTIQEKGITGFDINYLFETRPDELVQISQKSEADSFWIQISNSRSVSTNCKIFLQRS